MDILVVNDDGINAPGLEALAAELRKFGNVTVVAPEDEQSGTSCAITIHSILKVKEVKRNGSFFGYSVSGTPSDCVKLALSNLVKKQPDYVFSGINSGANLSSNVYYSGTVSAANEGLMAGITSCAVSLSSYSAKINEFDFTPSAVMAGKWLKLLEEGKYPQKKLYNINVPPLPVDELKGFKAARLANRPIKFQYDERKSPHGASYYWLSGVEEPMGTELEQDSDIYVVGKGYVAVTPLGGMDRTDYTVLQKMQEMGVVKDEK